MGVSFQDQHPQDAGAFCRPYNMNSRLRPTDTKNIGCFSDELCGAAAKGDEEPKLEIW